MKKILKLTGGSFSGRKLYVPGGGVRPATNLVREATFSTLLSFFPLGMDGLEVLDLFAGSGSLGLEALSRGAKKVTFVDSSREAVTSIRKNLFLLGFRGEVIKNDVREYLRKVKDITFDLVFMDPPYDYNFCNEVVELLVNAFCPSHSAVLCYERRYVKESPGFEQKLELLKSKKYGQTEVLYYRILKKGC